MPEILVKVTVPDGEWCGRCGQIRGTYENRWCEFFGPLKTIDDGQSYISSRLPQCIAAETRGWQPIETAAEKTEYLLRWAKTGHIEDGYVYRDDNDVLRHVLYDGESLNDEPTHFIPIPPPPVGK